MFYRAGCFSVLFFSLIFSSLTFACEPQINASFWERVISDEQGGELGYLHCQNNYVRTYVGLSVFEEENNNFYGTSIDLRLQPSWQVSPFVSIGGTAGVHSRETNPALWTWALFGYTSAGLSAVYGHVGVSYAYSEMVEQRDSPIYKPKRHMFGLIYQF